MNEIPMVKAQMLIRKPVATVFNAIIDPTVTTNFWFAKSSGKLEEGKMVIWDWEMYGVSVPVVTHKIIANQLIETSWGDPATTVTYEFKAVDEECTYVEIKNFGFHQTGVDLIAVINDSAGGFTTVLDGMKAYLEFGIQLNLIADKFPKRINR